MKLHLLSDLHLEFKDYEPSQVEADAIVLAGDIGTGLMGLEWAAQSFRDTPVAYVIGNHELYGWDVQVWMAKARDFLRKYPNITLCHQDSVLLKKPGEPDVRILGVTLWTDFLLFGEGMKVSSGIAANTGISDYKLIRTQGRRLNWQDTVTWHRQDLDWLCAQIQQAKLRGEKIVVATHHAPTEQGSHSMYRGSSLSPAFCSNLEGLLAGGDICAWLFGHTHYNARAQVGSCVVVANQRGYPLKGGTFEAPDFQADLVIEV